MQTQALTSQHAIQNTVVQACKAKGQPTKETIVSNPALNRITNDVP